MIWSCLHQCTMTVAREKGTGEQYMAFWLKKLPFLKRVCNLSLSTIEQANTSQPTHKRWTHWHTRQPQWSQCLWEISLSSQYVAWQACRHVLYSRRKSVAVNRSNPKATENQTFACPYLIWDYDHLCLSHISGKVKRGAVCSISVSSMVEVSNLWG